VRIAADFLGKAQLTEMGNSLCNRLQGLFFCISERHDGQIALHTIKEELPAFEAADQGFAAGKT
jgi:hypothetical protein